MSSARPNGRRRTVAGVGAVCVLAGLAGIARALILDGSQKKPYLLQVSTTSLLIGVVMIGQSIMFKRPQADDQEYLLGYDVGHAKGESDERERTHPTVVDKMKWQQEKGPN